MLRLATLDIAGTTVDDGHQVYDALEQAVARLGATISETDLQQWMGTEKRAAIAGLAHEYGLEPTEDEIDDAFTWFLEHLAQQYRDCPPSPIPGAANTIAELRDRGIKVCLTTGFTRSITEPLLDGLGWTIGAGDPSHTVDAVVCADEVTRGRPAPYMIHRAMQLLDVDDVRYVSATGDTLADARAARAAGVLSIAVTTGKLTAPDFTSADVDHILPSVAHLPELPAFTPRTLVGASR